MEEVFATAIDALYYIMGVGRVCGSGKDTRAKNLEACAPDPALLLVAFLNEVLYLFDAEGVLVSHISSIKFLETRVLAEATVVTYDPSIHGTVREVKAATMHGASLDLTPQGYTARVFFDL